MSSAIVFDALVEASARATAVAAVTAAALALFKVKSPSVRHVSWTAALLAMLALPWISRVVPTVHVPVRVPEFSFGTLTPVAAPVSLATAPVKRVPAFPSSSAVQPLASADRTSGITGAKVVAQPGLKADTWQTWVILVWFGVGLVLVAREVAGAEMARRLLRRGVPVDGDAPTLISPLVVTPVVVGVLSPRVMVPPAWATWGADVREMVLMHERAHIDRRDPLIACLARLNRAVFWFHPLAWWLKRHLSRTAEMVCDERVMRVAEPRAYAALLVQMARRLHQHNRRVAWQGIGVIDGRQFEDRVGRILNGISPGMSRTRKIALAVVSSVLISLAMACGTGAAPLAEDPELAKEIAAAEARTGESRPSVTTTVDDLPVLEKAVADNPADMAATLRLIGFYRNHGQKVLGWDRMVAGLRPHLLRLIERDPESQQAYWTFSRAQDPEGYAGARALWMAHVDAPGARPIILAQASEFFAREEHFVAEELLLRGQRADPRGPTVVENGRTITRSPWYGRFGRLYARGVLGVTDGVFGVVSASDPVAAKGAFAQHARKVLSNTNDARLLMSAGTFMFYNARNLKLDYDHRALGREYVQRAALINPDGAAPSVLERIDLSVRHDTDWDEMVRAFGGYSNEVDDATFDRLADDLKLRYANGLIWGPHGQLMEAYQRKDSAGIQSKLTSFERRARNMLEVVARAPQTNPNSRVAADAHIALGTVAMRRGKVADAVRHLQQAASAGRPMEKVAGRNDDTSSLASVSAVRLTHELLDAGERETVAAFYETAATTVASHQRTDYETAAAAIRAGKMPAAYQRYLARMK